MANNTKPTASTATPNAVEERSFLEQARALGAESQYTEILFIPRGNSGPLVQRWGYPPDATEDARARMREQNAKVLVERFAKGSK